MTTRNCAGFRIASIAVLRCLAVNLPVLKIALLVAWGGSGFNAVILVDRVEYHNRAGRANCF